MHLVSSSSEISSFVKVCNIRLWSKPVSERLNNRKLDGFLIWKAAAAGLGGIY